MNDPGQRRTVVVIGGGYGGVTAAKALDEHANVVLVEPRHAFQHNVASLRALVEPSFLPSIFMPYDKLLTNGTVIHERAVEVDADRVVLASGQQLTPDFLVLATGSTYPFPGKTERPETAEAIAHYQAAHADLTKASRVVLVGAGAVGLELAGEIAVAWPDKQITLVDVADEILPGPFDPRLRDELNRQLDGLGVRRVLGSPLATLPTTAPGEVGGFSTVTARGDVIEGDIWFRCHGVTPVTGYLTGGLAAARDDAGYLAVKPELQVVGYDTVYALGDIADIDANKAGAATRQADVVSANIKAQLTGSAERVAYTAGPPAIVLPLGPTGGSGYLPGRDELLTTEFVVEIKGKAMMIDRYSVLLNRPSPERP